MLFAVILTLPFGFQAFQRFSQSLSAVASPNTQSTPSPNTQVPQASNSGGSTPSNSGGSTPSLSTPVPPADLRDGLMLLLPFILGFSTPLVLSVLNRFVQSAQSFFGVQTTTPLK